MRTRSRRALAGRLVGVVTALIVLATAVTTHAQTPFVPYYGKNQIRYDTFHWYIYTTDHFEILLLPGDRAATRADRRRTPRAPTSRSAPT